MVFLYIFIPTHNLQFQKVVENFNLILCYQSILCYPKELHKQKKLEFKNLSPYNNDFLAPSKMLFFISVFKSIIYLVFQECLNKRKLVASTKLYQNIFIIEKIFLNENFFTKNIFIFEKFSE
jgi:hypothetical protein